jgi:pilus assembly protein CpaE
VAAKRTPGREEMTHLMRFIRSTYQVSLIDFGRSVSVAALDALPELETLYLVTTPQRTALERAHRAIQIIESRGFNGDRLKVLLNRADDRKKSDLEAIEQTLGHPVETVFRNDHLSLYDAYSEGRFLPPANALAKEFHALAESIKLQALGERSRDKKESNPAPAATGGKGWLSFLNKVPGFQKDQGQRLHT